MNLITKIHLLWLHLMLIIIYLKDDRPKKKRIDKNKNTKFIEMNDSEEEYQGADSFEEINT